VIYVVRTEKFGNVLLDCKNIGQARKWARERFGVSNPECVSRQRTYKRCSVCDSKPCVCR